MGINSQFARNFAFPREPCLASSGSPSSSVGPSKPNWRDEPSRRRRLRAGGRLVPLPWQSRPILPPADPSNPPGLARDLIIALTGKPFYITSSRYRSMVTDYLVPMEKTFALLGPPRTSLPQGVTETTTCQKSRNA